MEITENELIKELKRFEKKNDSIIRGIGDDGAVVNMAQGPHVFVQDTVVEHIHFDFSLMNPRAVGKKAIYVNVSDILSMGALPLYFLVTIGIPDHMSRKDVHSLYGGIMQAAREFDVRLLGGDTSASKHDFFIDVSMVGRLTGARYLGRDTAREGDLIGVTGWLGESAYGLHLLQNGFAGSRKNRYIKRYVNPRPPFAVWKELMKQTIPMAMMDVSDGLIIDLERMMRESGKGAHLYFERLPIPRDIIRARMENLALAGGEDYQFLFTFPSSRLTLLEQMRKEGSPVAVIGKVVKGKGVKLFNQGSPVEITSKGYEHFGAME
jgi:thiamine-monophosphate kinase